jgi:hypothetical protein
MRFERRVISSNGEDILYFFHNRAQANFVLLAYNRITQSVATPIICAGASLFPTGTLVFFRNNHEPQKYHALQIWQTPFFDDLTAASSAKNRDSYLYKIGNPELVRAMAECNEIIKLLTKDDSFSGLYLDLAKQAGDLLDAYFWLDAPECHALAEPLRAIKKAAKAAVSEFEKVTILRQTAAERTATVREAVAKLVSSSKTTISDELPAYVHLLTSLRQLRGEIIALREVRYVEPAVIEALEQDVITAGDTVSEKTVTFLASEKALASYAKVIDEPPSWKCSSRWSADSRSRIRCRRRPSSSASPPSSPASTAPAAPSATAARNYPAARRRPSSPPASTCSPRLRPIPSTSRTPRRNAIPPSPN